MTIKIYGLLAVEQQLSLLDLGVPNFPFPPYLARITVLPENIRYSSPWFDKCTRNGDGSLPIFTIVNLNRYTADWCGNYVIATVEYRQITPYMEGPGFISRAIADPNLSPWT